MIFNSYAFALFLPVVWFLHWRLPDRGRLWLLLVASYVFYGAWDWRFLGLLAASTAVDHWVGRQLGRTEDGSRRRRLLVFSMATNLGILGFFKYFGFFVSTAVTMLSRIGLEPNEPLLSILLPVGISFYTFQSMSYTIDVYRREIDPIDDVLPFAVYVAYFPQLVAGPIERASRLLPQFRAPRSRPGADQIRSGLMLILLGLFRKVVIADSIAPFVNNVFSFPERHDSLTVIIAIVAFGIQIYGDFAGYSDIARGTSRLFGVELMVNFRHPYWSSNITDFWRRWHISLSTWLRDYLYIPLGGNRHGSLRTYRNLFLTMLLGGLWHGAAWTFVAWGALHGGYLTVHKLWRTVRPIEVRNAFTRTVAWLTTLGAAMFAWLFFRAETFVQARELLLRMRRLRFDFLDEDLITPVVIIGVSFLVDWLDRTRLRRPELVRTSVPVPTAAAAALAVVAIIVASGSRPEPFIYFQF